MAIVLDGTTGILNLDGIVVSGTVDGRDVAADGTKLDGIEAGATADQTAAQIKTHLENGIDSIHYVDGSIDTVHIGDDQVTAAKLANAINDAIAANTAKVTNSTSASDLTSGTLADARFPATLPAISAANLTDIAHVSTTAPSSPTQGDMWFDSTAGVNAMKVWSGSSWDQMSNKFTATGGTESTYSSGGINYKAHTFTSSGTFVAESSGSIDIMMVAGGGGGGAWVGSGGGAGGMIVRPAFAVTAQSYTVTIGAGGARGYNPGGYAGMPYVRTGDDTTAFALTAKGGGAGVSYSYEYAGGIGGSGSGGANNGTNYPSNAANQTSQSGDSGTYGFGNAGGSAPSSSGDPYPCAGGGGAGGVGGTSTTTAIGLGGVGKTNNYRTGSNIYYAGGGGGGHHGGDAAVTQWGTGGNGGGGNGNTTSLTNAQSGSANTGGGGGGGGGSGGSLSYGGYGGSGIVVVRYAV